MREECLRDGWLPGTCALPKRPCLQLCQCVVQSNARFKCHAQANERTHILEKIKYIKNVCTCHNELILLCHVIASRIDICTVCVCVHVSV